MTLYGRSFLTLLDYTPDEIRHILDLAKRLKREKHLRIGHRHLMGRCLKRPPRARAAPLRWRGATWAWA